jgi:hypothetical protein
MSRVHFYPKVTHFYGDGCCGRIECEVPDWRDRNLPLPERFKVAHSVTLRRSSDHSTPTVVRVFVRDSHDQAKAIVRATAKRWARVAP